MKHILSTILLISIAGPIVLVAQSHAAKRAVGPLEFLGKLLPGTTSEIFQAQTCEQILDGKHILPSVNESLSRDLVLPSTQQVGFVHYTISEVHALSPRQLQITTSQKVDLLARMHKLGPKTVAMLSPIGVTLWPQQEQLDDWLSLGFESALGSPLSAQMLVHSVGAKKQRVIRGISDYWVTQLQQSSMRLKAARDQAMLDLNQGLENQEDFSRRDPFEMIEAFHNLTKEHVHRLGSKMNAIEFSWGSDLRWLQHDMMSPEASLSVLRTLAIVTLIDRLVVFGKDKAFILKDDDVVNQDTLLLLASHPELISLLPLVINAPVDVNQHHRVGSPFEEFKIVHWAFATNGFKVRYSATIDTDERVLYMFEIESSDYKEELVEGLEEYLRQARQDVRRWMNSKSAEVVELHKDGESVLFMIDGPEKQQLALIAYRLREILSELPSH